MMGLLVAWLQGAPGSVNISGDTLKTVAEFAALVGVQMFGLSRQRKAATAASPATTKALADLAISFARLEERVNSFMALVDERAVRSDDRLTALEDHREPQRPIDVGSFMPPRR